MASVTSMDVAEYLPLIEVHARRLTGFARTEYDDLRQEGMISVWQTLKRGLLPSSEVISGRMIDLVRFNRRLLHNDGIAMELILPMEDYPDV